MPKASHLPKSVNKGVKNTQQPLGKPRTGNDFGKEGTNKTIPVPKPDGAQAEELGNTPHIKKSPYTRG